MIDFGAGAAELTTAVEGYQMTPAGPRRLGGGEVASGGGKVPGVLVPLAVLAGSGNPVGLIVGGTSRRAARRPARPRSKVRQGDGRQAHGADATDYRTPGMGLGRLSYGRRP